MAGAGELTQPAGTQEQPILVDEDQDAPHSGIGAEVEKLVRQVRKGDARFDPIDLGGEDDSLSEDPWRADEDNYDNDNAKIEREELATEPEDTQDGPCVHWKKAVRNPCPCGTHRKVPQIRIGSMDLGESQVVELKELVRVGRYGAEFVEIHEIWIPNKGDDIFIRGRAYARTRNLEGRIEPRKNEVCEIYELDENDHRVADPTNHLEQALVEVPVLDIKAIRTLHKTNKAFPECRFDRVRYRSKEERENEAPLTCRWQMVLSYPDPRYRRQQRPIAGEVIRHYTQDDIPKDRHRVPDSERRKAHEKIRGGSFVPNGAPKPGPEPSPVHMAPGQKYTVVDIFSGAGGYSKGAEMAGIKVLAACDHWPRCCETYRQNFPDTELHQEDVYKFIENLSTDLTREDLKADILHFSPPCQTWSPAHTCEGKKDEENRATLFACEKIITIFKPRIFTVEQTFGLAQDRWIPNFNALIQGFTRHGYSVKWKVLHLVEYGLPQTRKRLVMIGAAPGEQLPAWPRPTHSRDPKDGQKPFVSAFKACSSLVEGENLHDVECARPISKAPWDSSKPLGRTITTSGGQSYHPSGLREYTLGEFAVLQGFPVSFPFVGKCIKKQIGNAFAPIVVKTLLKCIRVHLEDFDGVTRQPPQGQVIIVCDDDDSDHDDDRPQLWHKDQSQIQVERQSMVEGLVGFRRKPSGVCQELLHGVIGDIPKKSARFFNTKENNESSRGGSSSGPSLRKPGRVSSSRGQLAQRNTVGSYFVPENDQDSQAAASAVFAGEFSLSPETTADPGADSGGDSGAGLSLFSPEYNHNTTTQDVTAGASSTHFHNPSTPLIFAEAQTSNVVQTTCRTISDATHQMSPGVDEPRDHQSAQTTLGNKNSSNRHLHSTADRSEEGPIRPICPMTIERGILRALPRDPSSSDTRRARMTIADLNDTPAPARPAPHHSPRQIRNGVLTGPRRQSPPGFLDIISPAQVPSPAPGVKDKEEALRGPLPQTSQHQEGSKTAATVPASMAASQAIEAVIEVAASSSLFGNLAEDLRSRPPVNLAAPSQSLRQNTNVIGVLRARRSSSRAEPATNIRPAGTGEGATTPGAQRFPSNHHGSLRQGGPGSRSSLFRASVSSSDHRAGIDAALRHTSQGFQGGDGAPGPSRSGPSRHSVAYTGETARDGARRSLAIMVEDDEDAQAGGSGGEGGSHDDGGAQAVGDGAETEDDRDQELQHALWASRAGAQATQEAPPSPPASRRGRALAFQRKMLDKYRRSQNNGAEETRGGGGGDAPAPAPAPTFVPETEMFGPGNPKGKGVAGARRKIDGFAGDEEAQGPAKPTKRPRGSK